jgi:hypothetical protein
MAENNIAASNTQFINQALERNYGMPNNVINALGQTIDIELDSVAGWAHSIDLSCFLQLNVVQTTMPSWSPFAPWNFFSEVQISLGGGPFQRVSPYFYYLREILGHDGWTPANSTLNVPSSASNQWNLPTMAAGNLDVQFTVRVPLQAVQGSVIGLLPMGSASTKVKIRLTVASSLYGTDQWLNPVYGGTGVTVTIGTGKTSYISPNINYYTSPATSATLPTPFIGSILNVQQRATQFVGAGALTPIKFPDPFKYLRLYHIIIDGTGAPNTTALTNFELDLVPGYPQYNYNTPSSLQSYFYKMRRTYGTDLPTGVFVFDQWSGSDPMNPNGTQIIDGSIWQTLQTQVQVSSGTNVASPAKIITFAEALSPVNF